ncbi:IclR family transcriptional regulator (plasmid) [Haloarcula marismortui]|uniref:IclR family transcriptional regulator n=1 Tax=Haloarcula marismortui TaxID=2238 RepID=UPI003C73BC31
MAHDTENTHKTTEQAIALLDTIRRANGANVSDLLSEFEMARSTLYTHLNTLQKAGFVVRENGQYWVGVRLKEFSVAATERKPSYQIVKNTMRSLGEEIEAEAEFLVEEGGRINVIYHSEAISHNRVRLYAHNTAAGKSLLSEMPDHRVQNILDRHGLPEQTQKTITDRETLLTQLEEISENGFAYNDGECFEGYHGIGTTIKGIHGGTLGAITIGGPVYRISEKRLRNEMVDTLLDTAESIENEIQSQRSAIITELSNQ